MMAAYRDCLPLKVRLQGCEDRVDREKEVGPRQAGAARLPLCPDAISLGVVSETMVANNIGRSTSPVSSIAGQESPPPPRCPAGPPIGEAHLSGGAPSDGSFDPSEGGAQPC